MTTGRWQLGLGLTLVTVSMWSVLPLFLQSALTFMPALSLNFFRFAGSGVILGLFLAYRGKLPPITAVDPNSGRPWWRSGATACLVLIAVLGLAGNYMFYLWSLELISAAAAQVVIQLAPAILVIGSIVVFGERFTRQQMIGFVCVVGGLVLFFNHRWGSLFVDQGDYGLGLLLVAVAAVTWAAYALAQKQLLRSLDSRQIMLIIYLACAVVFSPYADWSAFRSMSLGEWSVFWFAVLNTLLAYGAFAEAMYHWEASRVSAVLSLVPLGTITSAMWAEHYWPGLFVAEPLNGLSIMGAVILVGGSLLVAISRGGK